LQWELLVVDDASSDASVRIAAEYAQQDSRIQLIRQPANAGVAAARNAALKQASGDYIAFCDSDDWWMPSKLERQLEQMRTEGNLVSCTAYQRVDEEGRLLSTVRPPGKISFDDMLKSNYIGNLTGMYARSLGKFRFQKIGHEDYVFWLDCVRHAGGARCVEGDLPLACYLVRAGSVSANKVHAATWQWRIYRDVLHFSVTKSLVHMFHYMWNALRKRT
jgi:glycosyltransferase involved in cell wall biosynthesis